MIFKSILPVTLIISLLHCPYALIIFPAQATGLNPKLVDNGYGNDLHLVSSRLIVLIRTFSILNTTAVGGSPLDPSSAPSIDIAQSRSQVEAIPAGELFHQYASAIGNCWFQSSYQIVGGVIFENTILPPLLTDFRLYDHIRVAVNSDHVAWAILRVMDGVFPQVQETQQEWPVPTYYEVSLAGEPIAAIRTARGFHIGNATQGSNPVKVSANEEGDVGVRLAYAGQSMTIKTILALFLDMMRQVWQHRSTESIRVDGYPPGSVIESRNTQTGFKMVLEIRKTYISGFNVEWLDVHLGLAIVVAQMTLRGRWEGFTANFIIDNIVFVKASVITTTATRHLETDR